MAPDVIEVWYTASCPVSDDWVHPAVPPILFWRIFASAIRPDIPGVELMFRKQEDGRPVAEPNELLGLADTPEQAETAVSGDYVRKCCAGCLCRPVNRIDRPQP